MNFVTSFVIASVSVFAFTYLGSWYAVATHSNIERPIVLTTKFPFVTRGDAAIDCVCDGSPVSKLYHFC